MNAVDGSDHFTQDSEELPPSLLNIVLDTNPHAWAHLASTLPLQQAVASLLVFINAHLAFSNANKVSIIASNLQQAEFLYPSANDSESSSNGTSNGTDTQMKDSPNGTSNHGDDASTAATDSHLADANFYRPFAAISATLTKSLTNLLRTTLPTSSDLSSNPTTSLAGALTLALTYTNKLSVSSAPFSGGTSNPSTANPSSLPASTTASSAATKSPLTARILVLSASPASPAQYIPLMNAIFAAQRLRIPVDVLALTPSASAFLQQAADATSGTYMPLKYPHGFLQLLMQAYLPSPPSRGQLISPGQGDVDFRAACFCHRRVVDVGFVCSICLSIFCEPPEGAICLTCGSHLRLGQGWGKGPAVVVPKKKKKKKRFREEESESSRIGTPVSGTG